MKAEVAVLRDKGVLTLPVGLRRKYDLKAGETFSIIDLGDGAFVITRLASHMNGLADRVAEMIAEAGYSLDDLLLTLDEERESYYPEHYELGD